MVCNPLSMYAFGVQPGVSALAPVSAVKVYLFGGALVLCLHQSKASHNSPELHCAMSGQGLGLSKLCAPSRRCMTCGEPFPAHWRGTPSAHRPLHLHLTRKVYH